MRRACAGLPERPDFMLVDGNDPPVLSMPIEAIIGGDALVATIAAASIVAKVTRDAMMTRLDRVYPEGKPLRMTHAATTAWANERYTGGGYAVYGPRQMAAFWPVVREGLERISFAGAHHVLPRPGGEGRQDEDKGTDRRSHPACLLWARRYICLLYFLTL